MMRLGIDIETYSKADLKETGVYRYCDDESFKLLLIGYKLLGWESEDADVTVIDMTKPGAEKSDEFFVFKDALFNKDILKTAFNANFEMVCLSKYFGEDVGCNSQPWECTMVKALTMGLPGSLAGAGAALGLPEDKLKDPRGKQLIQYFSKPCKPTKANGERTRNRPIDDPQKWAEFIEYNRQDVVTEQEIYKRLSKYETTKKERRLWCIDQQINNEGVKIDMPMVDNIVEYDNKRRGELLEEARILTGLENPNSVSQLKDWLAEQGYITAELSKETVAAMLKYEELPLKVRRVLEIRQALGKSSVAKYQTMQTAACRDGRLRGMLQFYGANRSGRWAGKLVQVHNLARNTIPDLELARELAVEGRFDEMETLFGETAFVFSELVRTSFIPRDGYKFAVTDFSAIEARVISWLADEDWRLDAFREGKDIYCETASRMYGVPVVKHGENGELRQRGKVAELACGYQGGVGAMKRMDTTHSIPEEDLQQVVSDWRSANPRITRLWRTYENAAMLAIEEHRTVHCTHGIEFSYLDHILQIRLPSGRKLSYWGARIRTNPENGREQIVYKGVNQQTKQWEDTETYGGKMVENVVQATARDCLAEVMIKVDELNKKEMEKLQTKEPQYQIVMHIHDEIVVEVKKNNKEALNVLNAIMAEPVEWAAGLPLKGDGYETAFYKKD